MGAFPTESPAKRKQGGPLDLSVTVSSQVLGRFYLCPQRTQVLLNLIKNRRLEKFLNHQQVLSY
jgi:hypothetical protein